MKTNNHRLAKVKGFGAIETPETNPALLHFLSPLEIAAYQHSFKRMQYTIEGIRLDLDPLACRAILFASKQHAIKLRLALLPARIKLLKKSDPAIRRFLLRPLKQHQLPNRLYHILSENYCRKMESVALKGERGLMHMRGMGGTQMSYLMNLFIDNGCGSLFI
mgnify:CR=1 FL=1